MQTALALMSAMVSPGSILTSTRANTIAQSTGSVSVSRQDRSAIATAPRGGDRPCDEQHGREYQQQEGHDHERGGQRPERGRSSARMTGPAMLRSAVPVPTIRIASQISSPATWRDGRPP